jgi:D-cysteine desulfhydrase family pyridoxal phosphate-dependent enzyme
VQLGHFPTPLERMARLESRLGDALEAGVELWVKRDDQTGLAGGGNKTRKLEFLMAEAVERGARSVVTAGGIQSNHARQTAAAASRLGLECELVVDKPGRAREASFFDNGNALLDQLLGAEVHLVDSGVDMNALVETKARESTAAGTPCYPIPVGGSNALGALGYVECARELVNQAEAIGQRIAMVVRATGSAGTQAGLVAGFTALDYPCDVVGICVSRDAETQAARVAELTDEVLALLGCSAAKGGINTDDRFVGSGYGESTDSMIAAVQLAARTEALLLDPVYTGKAFAGLLQLGAEQALPKDGAITVFLHTGGSPALYAYPSLFATRIE